MKLFVKVLLLSFFLMCPLTARAADLAAPSEMAVGQSALVRVDNTAPGHSLEFIFQERAFTAFARPGGGYAGIIAADLKTEAGEYILKVVADGRVVAQQPVKVKTHDYGTRNITVEQKYVEPDEAVMERIVRENKIQLEIYNTPSPERYWQGGFIRPLDSAVVGKFGRRSIINGEPRSPHGGVDLRGAVGAPVKAPAAGRVVLIMDSYFSGNMVLIDHGQGLISGYRHLSKVSVSQGQMLKAGQVLGLVGATGRVTGPHLHFDIRLMGAVIDPLAFIDLSQALGRALQENK